MSLRMRGGLVLVLLAALASTYVAATPTSSTGTHRPISTVGAHAGSDAVRVDVSAARAFVGLVGVRADPARDAARHVLGTAVGFPASTRAGAQPLFVIASERTPDAPGGPALGSRAPPRSSD